MVIFLLPDFEDRNEPASEQPEINTQKKLFTNSLSSAAFRAGKSYWKSKDDQK